jgi:H+-transporting ATPase
MTPLGWGWPALVWAYTFIGALLNDRVKLIAYNVLDDPAAINPTAADH